MDAQCLSAVSPSLQSQSVRSFLPVSAFSATLPQKSHPTLNSRLLACYYCRSYCLLSPDSLKSNYISHIMASVFNMNSRSSLLILYKNILRACQTYPSKNKAGIYQAIREEWRDHTKLEDPQKIATQITLATKGLEQLRQYSEPVLSGGKANSPNWSVTLEQNPMPKPDDYDERKKDNKNPNKLQ
jgi:Complex 1 protein (LYR family)